MPEIPDALSELPGSAGFQVESLITFQLAIAAHLALRALSHICSRHKLAVQDWQVLSILGEGGTMTGKAIASRTRLHKTKISRAVAMLHGRKLISRSRNEHDLRESFLSLSKLGQSIYNELAPLVLSFERQVLDTVEAGDREAMKRALRRLTEIDIPQE